MMMRIPAATYRLQFHKDFGFAQATELVDYLHALGITCSGYISGNPITGILYLSESNSPVVTLRPGFEKHDYRHCHNARNSAQYA